LFRKQIESYQVAPAISRFIAFPALFLHIYSEKGALVEYQMADGLSTLILGFFIFFVTGRRLLCTLVLETSLNYVYLLNKL